MPLVLTKRETEDLDRRFKTVKEVNIVSKMATDEPITQSDLIKKKKLNVSFKNLSDKDKLLYYLAEQTEGFVGADIESLVRYVSYYK